MKHGLVAHVEAYYYVPVKQEKRGRKRKVGRRGKGGSGHYPLLSRLGVVANASPALCEDVVVEVLRESYEEAHEALVRAGVNISIKRMRTINIALGRRAVKLRNAKVADNEVEDSCAGKTIAVSVDGGRTLIRTNSKGRPLSSGYHRFDAEWREPKLFTISGILIPYRKIEALLFLQSLAWQYVATFFVASLFNYLRKQEKRPLLV